MLNNYEHRRGHDTERRGVDGNAQSRADSNSWAAQNLTLGGSLGVQKPTKKKNKKIAIQSATIPAEMQDGTDEEKLMQQLMGFSNFESTSGKQVKGNDVYASNRKVQRKYRQYMNRKGGFNRPLDFMP